MRKIKAPEFRRGSLAPSRVASKNNVFLFPGMNAAAMRTGKFLRFHFGCLPVLFFDCLAGIGQLRRRRTAHEQAFDTGPGLCFRPSRRIEKESRRHVRVDKRYELWRCRKVTFPFSLDHQL